jgi:organic hydroperoxide reductase OsmC/OhrA
MLWFLDLARQAGLVVERYRDEAEGFLARDAEGRLSMTRVILRPAVTLAEGQAAQALDAVHHAAHRACFIANSVKTEVVVEPRSA